MKKQTAGRDKLGKIAPKFAELNDDVLFGEVWSREDKLSARDRSLITISASGELLRKMCGTGNWIAGKRFSSSVTQDEVDDWLNNLSY